MTLTLPLSSSIPDQLHDQELDGASQGTTDDGAGRGGIGFLVRRKTRSTACRATEWPSCIPGSTRRVRRRMERRTSTGRPRSVDPLLAQCGYEKQWQRLGERRGADQDGGAVRRGTCTASRRISSRLRADTRHGRVSGYRYVDRTRASIGTRWRRGTRSNRRASACTCRRSAPGDGDGVRGARGGC